MAQSTMCHCGQKLTYGPRCSQCELTAKARQAEDDFGLRFAVIRDMQRQGLLGVLEDEAIPLGIARFMAQAHVKERASQDLAKRRLIRQVNGMAKIAWQQEDHQHALADEKALLGP